MLAQPPDLLQWYETREGGDICSLYRVSCALREGVREEGEPVVSALLIFKIEI